MKYYFVKAYDVMLDDPDMTGNMLYVSLIIQRHNTLWGNTPIKQSDIAEKCKLAISTVRIILKKLENKEFITRKSNGKRVADSINFYEIESIYTNQDAQSRPIKTPFDHRKSVIKPDLIDENRRSIRKTKRNKKIKSGEITHHDNQTLHFEAGKTNSKSEIEKVVSLSRKKTEKAKTKKLLKRVERKSKPRVLVSSDDSIIELTHHDVVEKYRELYREKYNTTGKVTNIDKRNLKLELKNGFTVQMILDCLDEYFIRWQYYESRMKWNDQTFKWFLMKLRTLNESVVKDEKRKNNSGKKQERFNVGVWR